MVAICTYNARTLASESSIEDLLMQARRIRYDVNGLAETRRRHLFNAVCETGEELFLGTCDSRGVGGVGVLVNTSFSMNIDSCGQLMTQVARLRLKRFGPIPTLIIFIVHVPTSNYDKDKIEVLHVDVKKSFREDHTFFKVIIGDFNAKTGPRTTCEEHYIGTHGLGGNEQCEQLSL
uniref:Endo/exonuclease/phosphatase domain-containing protein n=1 Tax=Angiostrongylus cantonensis TaxID=6313 RepID=A0A0K0DEA4_ANGCA